MSTSTNRAPSVVGSSLRFWWVVAACTVVGVVAAFLFSSTQDTVVPARGRVVLSDLRTPTFDTGDINRAASVRAPEEAIVARSQAVFEVAAAASGVTYQELQATVKVAVDPDAPTTLTIDSRAPALGESIQRVNAVIEAYQQAAVAKYGAVITSVIGQLEADIAANEARLDELQSQFAGQAADDPARSDTQREIGIVQNIISTRQQRLAAVQNTQSTFEGGISLAAKADTASGPAEPNKRRNLAFGAALGLLIGIGGAWSLADRRQQQQGSDTGPAPVVNLSFSRRAATESVAVPPAGIGPARIALALAHVAARSAASTPGGAVIALTSPTGASRATEVAMTLAQIAADDGKRVLLVNARGAQIPRAGATTNGTPATVSTSTGAAFDVTQLPASPWGTRDDLSGGDTTERMRAARERYSTVILLLPALSEPGALAGLSSADSSLLVSPTNEKLDLDLATVFAASGAPLSAVLRYRTRTSSPRR